MYSFIEFLDVKDEALNNLIIKTYLENPGLKVTQIVRLLANMGHYTYQSVVSYVINNWKKTQKATKPAAKPIRPKVQPVQKPQEPFSINRLFGVPEPEPTVPKLADVVRDIYLKNPMQTANQIIQKIPAEVANDFFNHPSAHGANIQALKDINAKDYKGALLTMISIFRNPSTTNTSYSDTSRHIDFGHGTGGGRRIYRSSRTS